MIIVILLFALSLNLFTWDFNCFNQLSLWKKRRFPQFITNICYNSDDNTDREEPQELSNLSQAVIRTQELAANGTRKETPKEDNYSLIKVIIALNIIDIFYFSAYPIYLFRIFDDELVKYSTYIFAIFFIINHSANVIVYLLLYRRFTSKCFEIYNSVSYLNFKGFRLIL